VLIPVSALADAHEMNITAKQRNFIF